MRLACLVFLVMTSSLYAGGQKPPVITIRLHAEGNKSDGENFVTPIKLLNPPMQIYVDTVPVVNEKDIREFLPIANQNGSIGAEFQLGSEGANKIYQMGIEKKGGIGVILINGRVACAVRIGDKPVTDGILYVPSGFTPGEIQALETLYPVIGKESEFSGKKKQHPKPSPTPIPDAQMPRMQPAATAPMQQTGTQ